jgi:hypothetical protein
MQRPIYWSGDAFQASGQAAGLVMIGSETSYTSCGNFFNVKEALACQDDPETRLNQRNWEAIDPVQGVVRFNNTRDEGLGQGGETGHANSFSKGYRRIDGYFE